MVYLKRATVMFVMDDGIKKEEFRIRTHIHGRINLLLRLIINVPAPEHKHQLFTLRLFRVLAPTKFGKCFNISYL